VRAEGDAGRSLMILPECGRIWILAERVPSKRGRHRLQFIATKPATSDD